MKLLNPSNYRLEAAQEAWLQETANKQGHGNKAAVLRTLVNQAMKQNGKKREVHR